MAHHSYWNLGGHDSGTILDHELMMPADKYTPGKVFHPKSDPVPYGEVKPVAGTPFDFTKPKAIGKDNQAVGGTPIGYDNNWVVNGEPHDMRLVAKVKEPKSGRVMTVEANQPGVQFYAGIFLDGALEGKGGAKYPQYGFFCMETQAYPNAINVPEWQDQVILKPGETYKHNMVHKFTTEGS
jgi:aldose 1-epimerase